MMTTKLRAILFALPLLLVATGESFAWQKNNFPGTRDQVRSACAKAGGEILEAPNSTACLGTSSGAGLTCYDNGTCDAGGPGPAPRIRMGFLDVVGVLVGAARVKVPDAVPQSLVSSEPINDTTPAGSGAGASADGYSMGQWHANTPGQIN